MVQQVKNGKKIKMGAAIKDAFLRDFWKALPVLLVWAVIWFLLNLLQVIFSKSKGNSKASGELTAHSAVGTLIGDGGSFGLSSLSFQAL